MRFVRLKLAFHYNTLLEQIRQPCHHKRIEHVDLEEELVANGISKERDSFYECDSCHKLCVILILTASVAYAQCVIDRDV